jgi:uncharacterized membrane protein
MGKRIVAFSFSIAFALSAVISVFHQANASPAVVRAVLFYSPTCPHCEYVIQNTLPPLVAQYPQTLVLVKVDVSTPAGGELYQTMVARYNLPDDRLGVPALVIGDQVLVGSQEIPEKFPVLIQSDLSKGGVTWPDIQGLSSYTQGLESISQPESTAPGWLQRIQDRFLRDAVGNSLAVIVLISMLISLALVAYKFVMGDQGSARPWPGWVIPVLALLGMGVAIYLTFVETTKSSAFCGPIGDCNSVQQSPYARLFGVLPVGILGLLGYLTILILWIVQIFSNERLRRLTWLALWGLAIFGLLFSIYLTFLEPFIIGATCIWCISSAIIITLLLWATTPLALIAASPTEDHPGE